MKQHKQRVWSKRHGKFIQDWMVGLHLGKFDMWRKSRIPDDEIFKEDFNEDNAVIQDALGQKDFSGQELYEGDIVVMYRNKFKQQPFGETGFFTKLIPVDPKDVPDIVCGHGVVKYDDIGMVVVECVVQMEKGKIYPFIELNEKGEWRGVLDIINPVYLFEVVGNTLENPELIPA